MSQPPGTDPQTLATLAAEELSRTVGGPHDVAVVMGSGWAPAADAFGAPAASVAIGGLPGFAAPTSTRGAASTRSCTACAPRPPPA